MLKSRRDSMVFRVERSAARNPAGGRRLLPDSDRSRAQQGFDFTIRTFRSPERHEITIRRKIAHHSS